MTARSRLPFRQWTTLDGAGGRSATLPDAPKPPLEAWLCSSTYRHALATRRSAPSAPIWSRKIRLQTVPVYFRPYPAPRLSQKPSGSW
jgi:hypothetical protein